MAVTEAGAPAAISIETCTGAALRKIIPELAALRIEVFREWPYLYEGDAAYEARYLDLYVRSKQAAIVVARQGSIVGASTCLPLADESDDVQAPFLARGWDVRDYFYFGESVLRPGLRGQGVGVRFFEAREAHARAVSRAQYACFCGVVRPAGHPARPPGWVPLDSFWHRRGFVRRPDLMCRMRWTDAGDAAERSHDMVFWMKSLHGAPLP